MSFFIRYYKAEIKKYLKKVYSAIGIHFQCKYSKTDIFLIFYSDFCGLFLKILKLSCIKFYSLIDTRIFTIRLQYMTTVTLHSYLYF